MYTFPGQFFHPWLPPQRCETEEKFLDLLTADEYGKHWRNTAYTNAEIVELRRERAEKQKQDSALRHATLVDKARLRRAIQQLASYLGGAVQIIEGYRRAIVISPGQAMASIYILRDDGLLTLNGYVPFENVLPDGSILPSAPLTPVTGHYAWSPPPSSTSFQPAALDLEGDEWQELSPSSKKTRGRSRRYADRETFLQDLGCVLDAWRVYRPGKDPTIQELGDTPLPDGVIEAGAALGRQVLWPLGMSRSALGKLLGKNNGHGINLDDFKRERPRPRRP